MTEQIINQLCSMHKCYKLLVTFAKQVSHRLSLLGLWGVGVLHEVFLDGEVFFYLLWTARPIDQPCGC